MSSRPSTRSTAKTVPAQRGRGRGLMAYIPASVPEPPSPLPLRDRIAAGGGRGTAQCRDNSATIGSRRQPPREASRKAKQMIFNEADSDVEEPVLPAEVLEAAGGDSSDGETSADDSSSEDEYLYELPEEILSVIDQSDSEFDSDESENDVNEDEPCIAASGRRWFAMPSNVAVGGREPSRNIFRPTAGVTREFNPRSRKDAFLLFFDELVDECVRYTNLEARRVIAIYNRGTAAKMSWKEVTRKEMEAFIGLHVIGGALKCHYRNTSLWSQRDGPAVYEATMSRERFLSIKRFFRCDDRNRRDKKDPLSPVRHVWNLFSAKIGRFYVPRSDLTIDEQLVEYHGRVKFRVYIRSKPGRFGLKIIWLCEADSGYALAGLPYIGVNTLSEEQKHGLTIPEATTLTLAKNYLRKGHNITMDNWFSSVNLADKLSAVESTMVGTMRLNRREIPREAKDLHGRQRKSSRFYKSESNLLVSYWDKGTQPVLLLSTFHRSTAVLQSGLPEIVDYYNATKSGVDMMDRNVRYYSVKRKCFRWPYSFVCNLIDIGLNNASILSNKLDKSEKGTYKYDFMLDVGYSLVDDHIKERLCSRSLNKRILSAMNLLGYSKTCAAAADATTDVIRRGRCVECPRLHDQKTTMKCSLCAQFICSKHSCKVVLCTNCSANCAMHE
jgi:hypothetical protein